MMNEIYNSFIVFFYCIQFLFVVFFTFVFRKRNREFKGWSGNRSFDWPNAEVVLCLRGADKNLFCLLQSLSNQSYLGSWKLQIIIDSIEDTSRKINQNIDRPQVRKNLNKLLKLLLIHFLLFLKVLNSYWIKFQMLE